MTMKTTPDISKPKRRRFFTWHTLRRLVIGLAWIATVVALLYGVENWRCNRAWERYRADAGALGEHLDWKYFIPPTLPDDRNFATANATTRALFDPDLQKLFVWSDQFSKVTRRVITSGVGSGITGPGHFHFIDLATWEKALAAGNYKGLPSKGSELGNGDDPDPASRVAAAPGVLRGLEDCVPIIEAVREASSRPEARYPVNYDTENPAMIALPFYSQLLKICDRLTLRASAELALGKSDEALNDLKLMFYISDSNKSESFLIAILVRDSILALESQVIWEGLASHRWTDVQLREIQQSLLSRDFTGEIRRAIDMEQAVAVSTLEYYGFEAKGGFFDAKGSFCALLDLENLFAGRDDIPEMKSFPKRVLVWMMPRGWFRLEQINSCKTLQARTKSVFDSAEQRIYPGQWAANAAAEPPVPVDAMQALFEHRFAAWKMIVVTDAPLICKLAASRCIADEAAIACGLERCRLANGKYPAQLNALAPAFIPTLPHDALTGESYRYRLDGADQYTLYSVGWDLKDDGGKPGAKWYGPDGDWVWQ